jgi:hypothetical protein
MDGRHWPLVECFPSGQKKQITTIRAANAAATAQNRGA